MAIRSVFNMLERLRDWLLPRVICSVDPRDIIQVREGQQGKQIVLLGQEPLSPTDLRQLKIEVESLQRFRLWRIIQETIKDKAIEKALLQSTSYEGVLSGKMMLHDIGIINSIVSLVEKLRDPENPIITK